MLSDAARETERRFADVLAALQAEAEAAERARLEAEVATSRAQLADERLEAMVDELGTLRQRDRQQRVGLAALAEALRRTEAQLAAVTQAMRDAPDEAPPRAPPRRFSLGALLRAGRST